MVPYIGTDAQFEKDKSETEFDVLIGRRVGRTSEDSCGYLDYPQIEFRKSTNNQNNPKANTKNTKLDVTQRPVRKWIETTLLTFIFEQNSAIRVVRYIVAGRCCKKKTRLTIVLGG